MYRLAAKIPLPAVSNWLRSHAEARIHLHRALDGIDFTLVRGEALGIIGHNGSGKSTLLQIVAGVLEPTAGEVEVHGRVAALLELGSGFNPELTGRENVRVNAAILGLTPAQVRDRMDDIIAFADIGEYIDEPVKTYSSGMALRLAFAVQVHTDPDILIVDEALAVGDAAFQAKAMARIEEILARGTTLLFVGHDLAVLKAFCHRAMLLERGRLVMEGLPEDVITEYLHRSHTRNLSKLGYQQDGSELKRLDDGFGFDDVRVLEASVNGSPHVAVGYGAPLEFVLRVRLRPDVTNPLMIFDLMDTRGMQLTGRRIRLPRVAEPGDVTVRVALHASLQMGVYRVRMRLLDSENVHQHIVLARQEGSPSFEVVDDSRERFTGLFDLPMDVEVRA
ncbi:ABC transporter ATP-binding protein [Pseudoxanthomonas suwonensis]|jgi:ABC-type polysaccharide/polyol phosphate transport system, ATPase component|uniref:ABC transporter ATP-binding protein n=1 Tax=Pseudoxanthomonas suwonensis TaxID=314722 RepID=UPI0004665D09|nr:ABC transporter ATP-binding protein [Pseudoxanthomonas suwonensis]